MAPLNHKNQATKKLKIQQRAREQLQKQLQMREEIDSN